MLPLEFDLPELLLLEEFDRAGLLLREVFDEFVRTELLLELDVAGL
ncbi:MAG: hypothetical protein O3C07_06080 [Bacteroidetes bacterium]|nr:hypothetical protein [Bacteroidota bacterium]